MPAKAGISGQEVAHILPETPAFAGVTLMTDLSDDELERYARHIVLREVGGVGQRKLLSLIHI